jgi:hypothetical protein
VGREGIFAGSLLGRAAKVRDRCANSRLQNSSSGINGGKRATTVMSHPSQISPQRLFFLFSGTHAERCTSIVVMNNFSCFTVDPVSIHAVMVNT